MRAGPEVLVDTSVWIDHLRGATGPEQDALDAALRRRGTAVTDVVLLEVLAGPTDEVAADRLRRYLAGARHLHQLSPRDVEDAAALHRACRRGGETVRSLNDCLIAAVALRHGLPVLHRDRDFDVIARHSRLLTALPGA